MTRGTKNSIKVGIAIITLFIIGLILLNSCTVNIGAGYVGYKYDRTIQTGDPKAIPGTSVIAQPLTGLVIKNPWTQDVLKFPTTIVACNWTCLEEGDNKTDMSMQAGSKEGKNVIADIYISVRPKDIGKIISSFGMKQFSRIVDDDIYGLTKGKLSIITQSYSIYDIQSKRSEIQESTFNLLSKELENTYGVELVRLEIGTLTLPKDIQEKIDQKTEAQNAVELAKLDRQKQDEVNQKVVDEQKANSEKELLRRQGEADASAYEKEKASEASLQISQNEVAIAEQNLAKSKLEKEAELEKQKAYTDSYFKDKSLDVTLAAVKAINPSLKTIITSGDGEGYSAIIGLKDVLASINE